MPSTIRLGVVDRSNQSRRLLREPAGVDYVFIDPVPERTHELGELEALFVWGVSESFVRDNWLWFQGLSWIHASSAGVDHLLFPGLVQSDVVLTNSSHVFDQAMAEYAIGLVICMAKDFAATFRSQAEHTWDYRETETVAGKTLVFVGVGPIARHTARLAKALGMNVRGVGKSARRADPDFGDVLPSTMLPDLLPEADYVLLIAPHTSETQGLMGREAFASLKPSARLINLGRASILDEAELRRALDERRIAGAALDVFDREPLPPDDPLWDMHNLLLSPHMAGDVVGCRDAVCRLFEENLGRWLGGQTLLNVVDKTLGYVPWGISP